MLKTKLKKGDQVKVIAGKFRGQTGVITDILRNKGRITIENLKIKKHQKPTQNEEGRIKEIPATIHISNVAFLDSKNKNQTTKIAYEIKDGKKYRIARKTGNKI